MGSLDPQPANLDVGGRRFLPSLLQSRAKTQAQDDWSGITDSKRRKKLQNRLNQRASRQRRKQTERISPASSSDGASDGAVEGVGAAAAPQSSSLALLHAADAHLGLHEIESVRILQADSQFTRQIMERLERLVTSYHLLGSPRTDLLFHIIQFNFSKALIENIRVLGLTSEDLHDDDAISLFNTTYPRRVGLDVAEQDALPSDLRPTAVQRAIKHHPWLDLLPVPHMRDNLIRAEGRYDEERLCRAMKGHGSMITGKTGIVVWRDPWDSCGWEVSEAFARDWSWVIRGCNELFRSTNYWRAQRGERPLFRTV